MKIIIGLILVGVSLLFTVLSLLRKNEPYFNFREVISNHLKLFENCKFQYIVFYGLPILFSVGLSMVYQAGASFYSELSIILGILLSMLFAMLSILGGYDLSDIEDEKQRQKGKNGIKQTANAIMFEAILIVGLLLYGLTVIVVSGTTLPFDYNVIKLVASGIAYYVFFVILLNLLLVLKNMSKIISFHLDAKREQKK